MTARTARWGTPLLAFSALTVAAVGVLAVGIGPVPPTIAMRIVLPSLALVLGALVLSAGHVSYPRVQNLRVYLAGYSVGIQGIVYALVRGFDTFFIDSVPIAPAGYAQLMLVFGLLGPYAYSLLPAFPTYRATRVTTRLLVGLQIAFLAVVRFMPASFGRLSVLVPDELISIPIVVVATLTVAIIVINALLPTQSFFLRGAFSGLALLAGGAWILPSLLGELGYHVSDDLIHILYAGLAPLFLSVSILFHILARMDHRVAYDPLLHVYNREYSNRILAEQTHISTKPPLAIMMIDIDHFKQVNDTHGHQAGDRVLFSIAQTIQKIVVPEGVVCRYGGEELIVFFAGRTGRDIIPLAKRLCATIEATDTTWKRQRIGVTVSIGLSDRKIARQPLGHVLQAADKALYIAKENGRNQVRFVRLKDPRKVAR
ncbi:MAG: GGDEF domain-containing protein [Spirochaetales bacterium]|nr:GGDEF domain-containing protein [Spirochaetales bacterium]